jgi:hypothetical protein
MEAEFAKIIDLLAGVVQGSVETGQFRAEYAAIKAGLTPEDLAELNTRVITAIAAWAPRRPELFRLLK